MYKKKPVPKKTVAPIDVRVSAKERIEKLIALVNKKHGEGTICTLSNAAGARIHKWSSGSITLDLALRGGLVHNKCTTLWGKRSSGKTAAATAAGVAYLRGQSRPAYTGERADKLKLVVVLDLEDTYDPAWAMIMGADPDRFLLAQASQGEKVFEIVCDLIDDKNTSILFIIDSVKAIIATADLELDSDAKQQPGTHARTMSRGLRKLWPRLKGNLLSDEPRHSIIFLNQSSMEIGKLFGDPEKLTGGMMYEHVQAQIIKFTRIGQIKREAKDRSSENIGFTNQFTVQKDKTGGAEGSVRTFTFYRHEVPSLRILAGTIDNASDIIIPAVTAGIITKEGNKHTFGSTVLGTKSLEEAAYFLRTHGSIYAAIEDTLLREVMDEKERLVARRKSFDDGTIRWDDKQAALEREMTSIVIEDVGEDDEDVFL